jgi:hypothetical protein
MNLGERESLTCRPLHDMASIPASLAATGRFRALELSEGQPSAQSSLRISAVATER